ASGVASDDAAVRQIAREELRAELLRGTTDPASDAAAHALAALVSQLDSSTDRADAAAALADVAVRHGKRVASMASSLLAHRDDPDAAVRTAVLRFVGTVGLAEEAAWVGERLSARDPAEAEA